MSVDDDESRERQKHTLPPFTLITPLETMAHKPPARPRQPVSRVRRQPRRSAWGMVLLGAGLVGILLSVIGLLLSAVPPPSRLQAAQATVTPPPGAVTATATTLPAQVFPPTPTIPVATATPSITLPANLTLPPFCDNATDGTPTPGPSPTATPVAAPTCTPCPYVFTGTAASHAQVKAALDTAADTYHLPRYLVEGIAQRESAWNPTLVSCSFDIGLMQLKYGYWQWLDELDVPTCGLQATAYSPYILEQNALLGTKLLAYLTCYYSYAGDAGGTLDNPGSGTVAYWYHQANLPYPDTTTTTSTPNPASLCAAVYNDPKQVIYKSLPATVQDRWSCPYTAKVGDSTLLDVVIATYNQGIGTTNAQGIQNGWYVTSTEADIMLLTGS